MQRANGAVETAIQGHVRPESAPFLTGPPDGAPFAAGITSWDVEEPGALRTGLVVPIGPDGTGTLAVYSRKAHAFDEDSVTLLATIARHAAPAIQNAFRFLDVQELAATDLRTGLRSALAFAEELPREVSAARRHGRPLCMIQVDLDDFGADQQGRSRRRSANEVLGRVRRARSARRFAAGTPPIGTPAAQTSSS